MASDEHQKLIAALINYFVTKLGFKILSAAYQGYSQPDKHGRHAPDIIAIDKNGILQLAEAKANYEDIYSETAAEEFVDFSNRIMTNGGAAVPLHIVVYKENEPDLIKRLTQLGLSPLIAQKIKIWTL